MEAHQLQHELAELAKYGRVLVLLDVCRSGAITKAGSARFDALTDRL